MFRHISPRLHVLLHKAHEGGGHGRGPSLALGLTPVEKTGPRPSPYLVTSDVHKQGASLGRVAALGVVSGLPEGAARN